MDDKCRGCGQRWEDGKCPHEPDCPWDAAFHKHWLDHGDGEAAEKYADKMVAKVEENVTPRAVANRAAN